jgi:hypothetical protein
MHNQSTNKKFIAITLKIVNMKITK